MFLEIDKPLQLKELYFLWPIGIPQLAIWITIMSLELGPSSSQILALMILPQNIGIALPPNEATKCINSLSVP